MPKTELKANEPKTSFSLSNAEELHAIIDVVPDAIIIADMKGVIHSFSRGAKRAFGYSEQEITGENLSLLIRSSDRDGHERFMLDQTKTGDLRMLGKRMVTTARHRDGSTFPIKLSIGTLETETSRGVVAFVRDLTETEETERELHTLQNELAHVSRISSVGSLATSLAHELNQPLTAVANYAHSARDLLSDPSKENIKLVQEALDQCASEALRAGQIVHRLRDFIKRGETQHQISSLSEIIEEACALALINGDGRGVDFDTELDPAADKVFVDSVQVQQVVLNLVRNALEAMMGSPHKKLRVQTQRKAKGFAQVSVIDSGPGMDQKVADRLFHPFNSSKSDGMGLGLSICHSIIQSHDGKIWVEPSEMGGTAFHFSIPLAEGRDHEL